MKAHEKHIINIAQQTYSPCQCETRNEASIKSRADSSTIKRAEVQMRLRKVYA